MGNILAADAAQTYTGIQAMSHKPKPKKHKTRSAAKESALIVHSKRFLNDPTDVDIGIDLYDALHKTAYQCDDAVIEHILNTNSDHPNFKLLVDELDYASSTRLLMPENQQSITCRLMTIPLIIVADQQTTRLSDDGALQVAKSFHAYSAISPGISIMVMPSLLTTDCICQNHGEHTAFDGLG
jgi:hypothetical protein